MKKFLVILLSILSLVGCDLTAYKNTYITKSDAFDRKYEKNIYSKENLEANNGIIRFPVVADVHCGREFADKDVHRNMDALYNYLDEMKKEGDVTPLLMLGDILDAETDKSIGATADFMKEVHKHNPDMYIVYAIGNHELSGCTVEEWEERYGSLSSNSLEGKLLLTGTYEIGKDDLLIYNINSAYRMFGRVQLKALENAFKANEDRNGGLKLITNHIPLSSSKVNQTLFNFVIGDERERNAMLRLMYEYGPTFLLSGHHHKGNTFNAYSDHSAEFIFSAFHQKGNFLESPGRWYLFQIDTKSGKCHIWGMSIWDKDNQITPDTTEAELTRLSSEHYEFSIR